MFNNRSLEVKVVKTPASTTSTTTEKAKITPQEIKSLILAVGTVVVAHAVAYTFCEIAIHTAKTKIK